MSEATKAGPTEGEWFPDLHAAGGTQYGVWRAHGDPTRIASLNSEIPAGEQRANAALMAASKELLEACEKAERLYSGLIELGISSDDPENEIPADLEFIKAAIRKARGGAT